MTKAIVLYDSRYGNTKIVAETIAEGLGSKNVEANLCHVTQIDVNAIPGYDIILIGSPNHMGRPTGDTKKAIKQLRKADLTGKKASVFDTCFKTEEGKAIGHMEKRIRKVAPNVQMISPGLSILVTDVKGPIAEGELPKCKEFGERIAES